MIKSNFANKPTGLEILTQSNIYDLHDVVVLDSGIISAAKFVDHTKNYRLFQKYNTAELEYVNRKMQDAYTVFKHHKSLTVEPVVTELHQLNDLLSYRLRNSSVQTSHTGICDRKTRYRRNNKEKALKNKELYSQIQQTLFDTVQCAKQSTAQVTKRDEYLFEILKELSHIRGLKEKNFDQFKKQRIDIFTDEKLVVQAYNRSLFDNKKVALVSNDQDVYKMWVALKEYFQTPYFKKHFPYCVRQLKKNPVTMIYPKKKKVLLTPRKIVNDILNLEPITADQKREVFDKTTNNRKYLVTIVKQEHQRKVRQEKNGAAPGI